MTVRLRPHHLLCILTYVGKGYGRDFTANMSAIVRRIASGEEIEIVSGPDDICSPRLNEQASHCHEARISLRDENAAQDISRCLGIGVEAGARINLGMPLKMALRRSFAAEDIRSACFGCEWTYLCRAVASSDFECSIL